MAERVLEVVGMAVMIAPVVLDLVVMIASVVLDLVVITQTVATQW